VESGIRLTSISKQIGSKTILDGVSLDIRGGEFFSLLGPSGCGKTTLLRIIAGLVQQTAGSVSIAGRTVDSIPSHRRPVGMIFQHLALFPHLNVHDNVAFGLNLRHLASSEIKRRVQSALELVSLGSFNRRRIHQLSGGQQQRVAIARALALEPKALLLDEPLGSLDVHLRQRLQVELKRIQEELGTTFIYVTHDQAEAFAMADRVGVMDAGRLLQVGQPAELYRRPATRFVASFLGDANLIDAEVAASPSGGMVAVTSGRLQFQVSASHPQPTGGIICLIRPEHITVGAAAEGKIHQFPARIERIQFLGAHTMYHVGLDTGHHLRALANPGNLDLHVGDEVTVGWRPTDVVLVPPESGGPATANSGL
jgi:spermidine/putrescine transport system ATP-binding protein